MFFLLHYHLMARQTCIASPIAKSKQSLSLQLGARMYLNGYLENSPVEKTTMLMTSSFNRLIESIYDSQSRPYVRACIIVVKPTGILNFYLHSNGVEVGCHDLSVNNIEYYEEKDIAHIIDDHLVLQSEQITHEDDQRFPMQKAKLFHYDETSDEKWFFVPLAFSKGWVRGRFFNMLCSEFTKRWSHSLATHHGILFADSDMFAAASRALDIDSLVLDVCNEITNPQVSLSEYDRVDYCRLFDQIAAQTYESKPSKGSVAFLSQDCCTEDKQTILFLDALSMNRSKHREIRKLLELVKLRGALLIDPETNLLYGLTLNSINSRGVTINFSDNCWTLIDKATPVFKSNRGHYIHAKSAYSTLIDLSNEAIDWIANPDKIVDIVTEASKQKHGTCLVISDSASAEAERLECCGRCVVISPTDLTMYPEFILPLSCIDGALLVDSSGVCVGIGAIVDGVATVKGSKARGARYNSLLNYVAWKKVTEPNNHYLVVIVSEDGTVDSFATETINIDELSPDNRNG